MIFILQNIRSAWNVGSIFRTADAVGGQVVCLGYTARPVEPAIKLIRKTAIGAEKTVKWYGMVSVNEVIEQFPHIDYQHFAIEINEQSENLLTYLSNHPVPNLDKVCLWLGNEIGGLDQSALNVCEHITHLPMKGLKESLNVANTATTVAYLFWQNLL